MTALALSAAPGVSSEARAADFGTLGKVYPIAEPDLIAAILGKLREKEASGELAALNEGMRDNARKYVRRPPPVAGITPTLKERSWEFDPRATLTKDLADHTGRVFAHAGQVVNPLDYVPFNRVLLFVDADRPEHIAWAKRHAGTDRAKTKVVLVKGDIEQAVKAFGYAIYFDQMGFLTRRFGIEHVPAIVHKVGDKVMVEERLAE